MGLLFSRWKKKESLAETLESLEKDIQVLKNSQQRTEQLRKTFIGYLVLYSIVLYILAALIFYFYYFPKNWKDRLIRSAPLLLFPIIVYGFKRVLHYIFVSRISKKEKRLEDLNERKRQVLEEVMEKETYKTAKDLLEKYDPNSELVQVDTSAASSATPTTNSQQQTAKGTAGTDLRHRNAATGKLENPVVPLQRTSSVPSLTEPPPQRPMGPGPPQGTPPTGMSPVVQRKANSLMNLSSPSGVIRGPVSPCPGPPKPAFPILPQERTVMDKVVEYLVGDGPNNRYALICKQCYSHNGMTLKEEYEYTTFRCCYCFHMNLAKRRRPTAPKLECDIGTPGQTKAEEQLMQNKQVNGVHTGESQTSTDAKVAKGEDASATADSETAVNSTEDHVEEKKEEGDGGGGGRGGGGIGGGGIGEKEEQE